MKTLSDIIPGTEIKKMREFGKKYRIPLKNIRGWFADGVRPYSRNIAKISAYFDVEEKKIVEFYNTHKNINYNSNDFTHVTDINHIWRSNNIIKFNKINLNHDNKLTHDYIKEKTAEWLAEGNKITILKAKKSKSSFNNYLNNYQDNYLLEFDTDI